MATINQLKAQANAAPKFVLFTNEFGFDMYVAANESEGMTDNTKDALQYSAGFDNAEIKLAYWKFQTGYNLQIKTL